MKKKLPVMIIFISSVLALIISLRLFWNMGIYVDEHGTSPDVVLGGTLNLYLDWLRLLLLAVSSWVSGIKLFRK